jgi:RNA polymerase sigma-70 factor (ECF subfamily)
MGARAEAIEEAIASHLDARDLKGAATEAMRGYGPGILAYLRAVLRDEHAAADAFGAFAERLWKAMGSFRREGTFRAWAYRIAWGAAVDVQRDGFRVRAVRLPTDEMAQIAEQVRTTQPSYLKSEAQGRFAALKEQLEPEDRSLLLLRVDLELSWSEIAQVMSEAGDTANQAALRKRFERIKARLRKEAKSK